MPLPVTALFAGLMGLWVVFLLFAVVGFRRGKKVSLGSGGDAEGERLIRAHANAIETIPVFLIMLGLAEGLGTPAWALYVIGVVFSAGRLMHGVHFLKARKGFALRFYGMILTVFGMIAAAIELLRHTLGF